MDRPYNSNLLPGWQIVADRLLLFPDSGLRDGAAGSVSGHAKACRACGVFYDGDRCWVCLARSDAIYGAFRVSALVAGAGFLVNMFAYVGLYPRLGEPVGEDLSKFSLHSDLPLILFFAIVALTLILLVSPKLMRSAAVIRLMFATLVLPVVAIATLSVLNGALDKYPSAATQALVIRKVESRSGPCLDVRIDWNQQQLQNCLGVDRRTYSTLEPGDSVTIVAHPGRFSQPWFSSFYADQPHDPK